MRDLSQERVGEFSVISMAILWSLFPILTILSYSGLPPITSLAWTTLLSVLFFSVFSFIKSSWVNVFKKEILVPLLVITFLLAILFYLLFFFGLKHTSAGNAGLIATFEVFFSFLFFNIWRKEFISREHITGAVFMLLSAFVIFSPNFSHVQIGDLLILAAAMVPPFGNLLQKQLRAKMRSEQILFYRSLFATPFLFLFAYLIGENITFPTPNLWIVLLINGIVLFGLTKILWIEGIYRIGVTKSISIVSIGPLFTLIFAYLILKEVPTTLQLVAVPLAMLGIYFLTRPNQQLELINKP